ncbi:MAG: hypothetical protein IKJ05_06045 [Oscillospiraceae bacterium]|nr:hypothetical protein [Oscillospiraceae bacterium]
MSKKQFVSFICFCTLALSLIFSTGELFKDKSTTLAGYYSQPENTIDVIVVGSSHVNSGYIPAVLWKEYGISAHNVFSWSQPIWISYHYIEEALKTQDIKMIVLDTYGVMYGNSHEQPSEVDKVSYRNSFSIDTGINRWRMIQTVDDCGIDLRDPVDFLNIIRYHTAWKNINSEMFTYDSHNDPDFFRGYGLQTNVENVRAPVKNTDAPRRMPYETALKYLDKIVELAEKKDIQLILAHTPYQFYPEENEIFNWLENYASEKNIPYINYAADYRDIGFDYSADMADMSHLNYKGAFKITRHLGQFISDNYPEMINESNPDRQLLDKDADKAYRVFKLHETRIEDYNKYFDFLAGDTSHVMIAAVSGDAEYTPEFAQACKKLGIELDKKPFTGVKEAEWQCFDEKTTLGDVTVSADDGTASIVVKDNDYHGNDTDIKFTIYDKILERTTFYINYNYATDSITISDYTAKLNGGIYD